jgi:hypothetical protein
MKTVAFLLGTLFLTTTAFGQGTQATVMFANSTETLITNCHTRLPQAGRTIKLGLYFTPDLSAVSNQATRAAMMLAKVTTNPPSPFEGRFNGSITFLPGIPIGSLVVLQIKAWPIQYVSFQDAVAAGAEVAESLPWVQPTGGSINPPPMIHQWGFRPFLFPQCEPPRVPLFVTRSGNKVRVDWPVGVPPTLQVNDGSSTNWQTLTSGTFVNDHWEFEVAPAGGVQLFRLAQ